MRKNRTPGLSQQPVVGIKEIPRTVSCEPVRAGRILSLGVGCLFAITERKRGLGKLRNHTVTLISISLIMQTCEKKQIILTIGFL